MRAGGGIISYVQDRMGDATQAEAAHMVELLDKSGYITRDGSGLASVDTSEIAEREWMAMLAEVSAYCGSYDVTGWRRGMTNG